MAMVLVPVMIIINGRVVVDRRGAGRRYTDR